ncbi:hypothetical protein TCAL_16877 [Tigriopus californicus]|uniref:ARMET N-terminal domain-containing protein n=1 Tax=Tigriopus californicus TaxID=6832 RepID=A0A553PBX3_TIGCA|nr:hypothetical protein TCAL_16877 [Tigriopus californicus]
MGNAHSAPAKKKNRSGSKGFVESNQFANESSNAKGSNFRGSIMNSFSKEDEELVTVALSNNHAEWQLSPEQKSCLRSCWVDLQSNIESVGVVTFLKLFETHPETLKPFIPDVNSVRELELNEWLRLLTSSYFPPSHWSVHAAVVDQSPLATVHCRLKWLSSADQDHFKPNHQRTQRNHPKRKGTLLRFTCDVFHTLYLQIDNESHHPHLGLSSLFGLALGLKAGDCEVCISVLTRFKDTLAKGEDKKTDVIEKKFKAYCKDLKLKENRFCYYLGGTEDAATGILSKMSQPLFLGHAHG